MGIHQIGRNATPRHATQRLTRRTASEGNQYSFGCCMQQSFNPSSQRKEPPNQPKSTRRKSFILGDTPRLHQHLRSPICKYSSILFYSSVACCCFALAAFSLSRACGAAPTTGSSGIDGRCISCIGNHWKGACYDMLCCVALYSNAGGCPHDGTRNLVAEIESNASMSLVGDCSIRFDSMESFKNYGVLFSIHLAIALWIAS